MHVGDPWGDAYKYGFLHANMDSPLLCLYSGVYLGSIYDLIMERIFSKHISLINFLML